MGGFVSSHALDIIFKEFERSKAVGIFSENCRCQLRTSYGLPCAHEQAIYFNKGHPIPLDSVDKFWRKLELSPCISLEDDDFDCEVELRVFNDQFKKHSRSGKISLLSKLKEIIAPSTTLVCEPTTHKTTRGRPSLKGNFFRKTRVDPPPQTQEPRRHSCSSEKKFVEPDVFKYQEPHRRSCYVDKKYFFTSIH